MPTTPRNHPPMIAHPGGIARTDASPSMVQTMTAVPVSVIGIESSWGSMRAFRCAALSGRAVRRIFSARLVHMAMCMRPDAHTNAGNLGRMAYPLLLVPPAGVTGSSVYPASKFCAKQKLRRCSDLIRRLALAARGPSSVGFSRSSRKQIFCARHRCLQRWECLSIEAVG